MKYIIGRALQFTGLVITGSALLLFFGQAKMGTLMMASGGGVLIFTIGWFLTR